MERGWREIHHGADIRLHRVFRVVIQYVTPAYLLFILGFWFYDNAKTVIGMSGVDPASRPYVIATRWLLIGLFAALALSMRAVLHRRRRIQELHPS